MRAVAHALMLAGVLLSISAAARKSVTVDEYQALPTGLAILRTGAFHLPIGTPPLSQVLPALPLLATSATLSPSSSEELSASWLAGVEFLKQNSTNYHALFMLGRVVSAIFLFLTVYLAYLLSLRWNGSRGALLTAVFASLCPNLLAHGSLVTPDIYLAASILGCLWAIDECLLRPGWRSSGWFGAVIGAASLMKLTGLLLFFLVPLVFCMRQEGKESSRKERLLHAAFACCVAVLVINAGYLFNGSFTRLGAFSFESGLLQGALRILPVSLPLPFPFHFVKALDQQLSDVGYASFLLGEFSLTGFPHYYLVALGVKTPVVTLALTALAAMLGPRLRAREIPALVLGLGLVLFFSLSGHKNIGIRYILFLYPMMALWIGRLGASSRFQWLRARPRMLRLGLSGACLALLATSILAWPNYISYFNWPSGGAESGHRYLLDSNLDWGQDLIALREYMDQHEIRSIDLAHFGRVPPEVYGIREYRVLGRRPKQRFAAISANLLWGMMYFVNGSDLRVLDPRPYAYYRQFKPVALVGGSIYVFDFGS